MSSCASDFVLMPSPGCLQVPVLVDGDNVVHESFEIAKYLEKTYPNGPSLFGGEGGEAGCLFANAYADAIMMRESFQEFNLPLSRLQIHNGISRKDAAFLLFGQQLQITLCSHLLVFADYFPLIMSDIYEKLDKDSAKYFKEDREKKMGKSLEELKEGRDVSFTA